MREEPGSDSIGMFEKKDKPVVKAEYPVYHRLNIAGEWKAE